MRRFLASLTPTRLFSIAVAVMALTEHYVEFPTPLVLGVIAAVLGIGEGAARAEVRRQDALRTDPTVSAED